MMDKLKIYTLVVLLLTCFSCSDFLEKDPDNSIPEEEALTNLKDCDDYVVGIYSAFKNSALYSGLLTILPDLQADFVYPVNGYSNVYGEIYRWEIRATNEQVSAVYQGLYLVVARCNFFMDCREEVEASLETESDWDNYNKRLGEVYFARALAYSELIKMFCEAYDPLRAEEQLGISLSETYKNAGATPRSSLKASYAQVISDLNQAEKLIPKSRTVADNPYFSLGAVAALKARVYLYMEEWDQAAAYSSKVIDSLNAYSLADAVYNKYVDDNGSPLTEYDVMWLYDEGDEIIWKIAMSNTDRGGALGTLFLGYNGSDFNPDYVPAQWVLDLYGSTDMRYNTYFRKVETGYSHGLSWPILKKYYGNPEIDAGGPPLFTNMPKVFRLSEQYLIRAEAYYQKSLMNATYASKANDDLTTLRRKRYTSYGGAGYTGDALRDEIRDERVRELYMEGFRLADLRRYHLGFERKAQLQTLDGPNKMKIDKNNLLFTWPIPQHELDAGMGAVEPNASNSIK